MKENLREKELVIVLYGGTKAILKYKIDENVDDYIWEDFRNGWEENALWFPQDWADFEMSICGITINELDMRKVIGASY